MPPLPDDPSPPSPPSRPWGPWAAIAGLVLGLSLAFAWVAGWIGPAGRLTAPRLVDDIENGKPFPGFRRAHSRGVCVAGYFEPSAEAATLSRARVFRQPRTPVQGRLSIGGGDPFGAEAQARVRSLALSLRTDDGQEWRMAMNSFPFFAVATPAGFHAQLLASRPDPATGKPDPAKMAAFLERYPEAARFQAWAKSAPWSSSWANTEYNGVNAFRFIDAQGRSRFVRWSMQPQAAFRTPIEPEMFTTTPVWLAFIKDDPLRLRTVTARFLLATRGLDRIIARGADDRQTRSLLIQAGQDRIVDNAGNRLLMARGPGDLAILTYPEETHSVQLDDVDRLVEDMSAWLEGRP